jgi:small multidrug resistance pump
LAGPPVYLPGPDAFTQRAVRGRGGQRGSTIMSVPNAIYLAIAIVAEVIATSALTKSDNFSRLLPSLVAIVGYAIAFWFLSLLLRTVPTGVVYAIWSGVGIVLIAAVGWVWFKQALDIPAMIGVGLIIAGVVVVNMFSESVRH